MVVRGNFEKGEFPHVPGNYVVAVGFSLTATAAVVGGFYESIRALGEVLDGAYVDTARSARRCLPVCGCGEDSIGI